tara:strand:- start:4010 stop:5593 length:1584 start_codon:yes stop_codon:yes gene_type:complete
MANGNDKDKKSKKYKVKKGDTLSQLAEEYGMTVEDILKLNPQYENNPDLIIPGEEIQLNMGNLDSAKEALNTFIDSAKDILKGDKKLEDTKLGQFFGKGKEFKDTKLGTALGGGKSFEETGVGQLLGGGKPFKDTKVGDFITSKTPLIGETPLIFGPNSKSKIKKFAKNLAGKDFYTMNSSEFGPDTEFTVSNKRTKLKGPEGSRVVTGSEKEEIDNLLKTAFPTQKRGGGLLKKYDDGGIFGDVASFFSDFKETGVGEYLTSDEGKEDIAGLQSFAGDMQNMGQAKKGETEKERLERLAEKSDAGDVFNYAVDMGDAGVDLISGDIPGAVLKFGKTLFEGFKKKKMRKDARKELKEIGKQEDIMVDNPMGSDFSTEVLAQEQPVDVPEEGLMYSMARGGMISPDVMPFLSDSYKRYLSQQYGAGGNVRTRVPSKNKRRPEYLKYALKGGGMVKGPSHEKGGVKFNVGGEVVELEGGEAVINKKSTEMFRPILSKMNQAGGGVSFARGGIVNPNVQKMVNRLMRKSR